ncbi:MAG: hypothetical protein WC869_00355 [Phycisphaerae bacterium]|jgi:hypothetical protein
MPVEISDEERMRRAVNTLRNVIRDKPELNRLLLGSTESTEPELRQCIIMALIDWNQTPPILAPVDLGNHPNKFLLMQGAAIEALTSAGIWHSREHMPSSDGGTSGDDHAKAAEYGSWIERYTADYERKKGDMKTALNIAAALGNMGVRSEYSWRIYGLQGEEW